MNDALKELSQDLTPGNSLVECWLDRHRPIGNEPMTPILNDLLDVHENIYGSRPHYTVNHIGKWRRGDSDIPVKIANLMRSELINYAFNEESGPEYVRLLCEYLRLPVLGTNKRFL